MVMDCPRSTISVLSLHSCYISVIYQWSLASRSLSVVTSGYSPALSCQSLSTGHLSPAAGGRYSALGGQAARGSASPDPRDATGMPSLAPLLGPPVTGLPAHLALRSLLFPGRAAELLENTSDSGKWACSGHARVTVTRCDSHGSHVGCRCRRPLALQ